jgi:hypothetical protein
MANAAIFIGWGEAARGREQKALQVFGEAIQFYARLQQQGEIESFEPVQLEPHGGDLRGFLLIRGDSEKLDRLRRTREFITLNARAELIVEHFGVVGAFIGEELNRIFAEFGAQAANLA